MSAGLARDLVTAITIALSCRDPAVGMGLLIDATDLAIRRQRRPDGIRLEPGEWQRLCAAENARSRKLYPHLFDKSPDEREADDWLEFLNTGR